jgi:hypothetical protein
MQGLLETPGLTVAGHLVHGQVKEAPLKAIAIAASPLPLPQGFQFLFFNYVACDT